MTEPLRMTGTAPPRRPHRRASRRRTPTPLDQLSDAVLAADHLGEVADHLIGHFVDQARRSGASWTDIGRSMGVTKQAAQKRFVPKGEPTSTRAGLRPVHRPGPQRRGRRRRTRPAPRATPRSGPSTWCSACSPSPRGWPAQALAAQGVDAGRGARGRHRAAAAGTDERPGAHPVRRRGEEGAGAHLPRGAAAGPQLRRHRAHPARAAGARGRRRRAHRARRSTRRRSRRR